MLVALTHAVRLGPSPSVAPNIINLVQGKHTQISGGVGVGCRKSGCSEHIVYKRCNISEIWQDRAKVNTGCLYEVKYEVRLPPKCMALNDQGF